MESLFPFGGDVVDVLICSCCWNAGFGYILVVRSEKKERNKGEEQR